MHDHIPEMIMLKALLAELPFSSIAVNMTNVDPEVNASPELWLDVIVTLPPALSVAVIVSQTTFTSALPSSDNDKSSGTLSKIGGSLSEIKKT